MAYTECVSMAFLPICVLFYFVKCSRSDQEHMHFGHQLQKLMFTEVEIKKNKHGMQSVNSCKCTVS